MSVQYHQLMEDGCTFCYNQWQNGYCLRFETFLNQSRNCTVKPSFSPSFSISDILRQCISWLFFYKKRNKFSQVSLWHTHTYNIYLTYVTLTLWFEMAIEHSLSRDYKKLHHNYYIHIYVYIYMYIYIYIKTKIELGKVLEEFCRKMRLKWYFRSEPTLYFKKRQFLLLDRMGNHLI